MTDHDLFGPSTLDGIFLRRILALKEEGLRGGSRGSSSQVVFFQSDPFDRSNLGAKGPGLFGIYYLLILTCH